MIVRLTDDGTLPYVQIKDQLRRMIITGVLPVDTRLPSIRHLAADLGVANNTVGRAYAELEGEGLVVGAGRRGTVVVDVTPSTGPERAEISESFRARAEELVLEARHRGLELEAVIDQIRSSYHRIALEGSR